MNNLEILEKALNALSTKEKLRLKHHLEIKTPIFCGDQADFDFFDDEGRA